MTASADRRNILLISMDDAVAFWKYKTVFGEILQTPNLDRICAQSTAFHAAYCQVPICGPSRAAMISGKSPFQSGFHNGTESVFDCVPPRDMWPYLLKKNGYFCSSAGKVEQRFVPLPPEIYHELYSDEPQSFRLDWRLPEAIRTEFGGFRNGFATVDEKDDKRFYDFQSSRSAIAFLRGYDREAPFYRGVGFYGPHGPWITPRRFKEMYDESRFTAPRAWERGFEEVAAIDAIAPSNFDTRKWKVWRKSVRNYFSALTHTDHHLGRVWDALKASRHADNTVVIIMADHGLHLGERNRFRKTTLWEQVANVPLIVHDPQNPVPQVVSDPVSTLDIGPTVMDYAGLPPLPGRTGRSLRPQVEWERFPDRAVPTFLFRNASVRKGKYRFIRYDDATTEFFDLSTDWWQTRNLGAEHPDYAAMQAAHADCCREYGFDPQAPEADIPLAVEAARAAG